MLAAYPIMAPQISDKLRPRHCLMLSKTCVAYGALLSWCCTRDPLSTTMYVCHPNVVEPLYLTKDPTSLVCLAFHNCANAMSHFTW